MNNLELTLDEYNELIALKKDASGVLVINDELHPHLTSRLIRLEEQDDIRDTDLSEIFLNLIIIAYENRKKVKIVDKVNDNNLKVFGLIAVYKDDQLFYLAKSPFVEGDTVLLPNLGLSEIYDTVFSFSDMRKLGVEDIGEFIPIVDEGAEPIFVVNVEAYKEFYSYKEAYATPERALMSILSSKDSLWNNFFDKKIITVDDFIKFWNGTVKIEMQ